MRHRGIARAVARLAAALLCTCASAAPAFAHDLEEPHPKSTPAPSWPGGKPEAHDVVVPVLLSIDASGNVTDVDIEAFVTPELDYAALEAAKRWTFEPAMRDGRPVPARIRSVVRFISSSSSPEDAHEHASDAHEHGHGGAHTHAAPPASPAEQPKTEPEVVRVAGTAPPRSASEIVRTRDVITAAPHRTGSDALLVVPGIFVTQHSGEGKAHQIFLRGFDAVHGQDLELWVGGIPVNEVSNIHGQGYADLHFVVPEIIREIDAQPGTFDPRQGDFAVAGTVRMKLGYAEPGATIKGSVGSFGARRLFLAYHPKESSEETFAAFESYSTDGFGPNRAARRASMIAQGTHDFDGGVSLRVLAATYTGRFDSAGVVPAADVESGQLDRFAVLDPRQGGYSARTQILTELHKDEETGRWSIAPFVVFRTLQLRQNFTGYLADTLRGGADRPGSDNNQQIDERITAGATASYRRQVKLLSPNDGIEVGAYGRYDTIEQSQRRLSDVNDAPTETLVDADVRGTNVAGYVDLSLRPVRALAVRGGIRADALAYAAQDRALPPGEAIVAQGRAAQGLHLGKKATIDWAALPRTHLLASYGDGFRSPQARSLSNGQNTVFAEVQSYELGLRYGEGARFGGSVAGFYTHLDSDLVFDPVTTRNESVPGTARRGVAAELLARAGEWLVLAGSATYTYASFTGSDTTYREGDRLPYVPSLVLRTDANAKTILTRVLQRDLVGSIGTGLEGLFGRPLPYGDFGRDIFLVDASAALRLKEVELRLDVFNLFDADWYDGQFVYASNFQRVQNPPRVPSRHVTVGAPRTTFLSLAIYL